MAMKKIAINDYAQQLEEILAKKQNGQFFDDTSYIYTSFVLLILLFFAKPF